MKQHAIHQISSLFCIFDTTGHNSQHCLAHEDILTDAWFSFDTEIVYVQNQNTVDWTVKCVASNLTCCICLFFC